MPTYELRFIPLDPEGELPTDEQLLLELVYGLCGTIKDGTEDVGRWSMTSVGIPRTDIRRLAKLLVERLQLPISVERVDEWIEWRRNNQCWVVSDEAAAEANRLMTLSEKPTVGCLLT